ncbi:hypothetical protein MMC20_001266, partial [Loxospora ochrophaea]|nr:hypothetical protein [Loxospora ochrophaea]
IKTTTPYFNNGIIDQRPNEKNENSNLGDIAYMVQISTIWSDVLAHIYRSSHQSPEVYLASYEAFYSNICNRLSGWASSLPSNLRFNRFNLESNVDNGHIGTFVSIHAFYHITFMKLNRHIRHGCLPTSTISHNIREAVRHAQELLDIIDTISAVDRKKRLTPNAPGQDPLDFSFSTPFAGYAVLAAIDILSAAGSLGPVFTDTLRRMNSCLDVIDELAHFWASAKGQRKAIRHRIEELANSVIDNGPGRHAWVLKIPIEKTYTADQDAFYPQNTITRGADLRLLKAMDVDVEEGDVLFIEEGDLARPESCTGYGFYPAR